MVEQLGSGGLISCLFPVLLPFVPSKAVQTFSLAYRCRGVQPPSGVSAHSTRSMAPYSEDCWCRIFAQRQVGVRLTHLCAFIALALFVNHYLMWFWRQVSLIYCKGLLLVVKASEIWWGAGYMFHGKTLSTLRQTTRGFEGDNRWFLITE